MPISEAYTLCERGEPVDIREFILKEMNDRNMSMRDFATFTHIAQPNISSFLKNPERVPTLDFLNKLSSATHVSLVTLMKMSFPEESRVEPSASSLVLAEKIDSLPDHAREAIEMLMRGYSK